MLFTKPKLSHKQRVLREIRRNPGITGWELSSRVTFKFNSRISDLRKDGHIIEARLRRLPSKQIVYGYHYVDQKEAGDE